MISKRFILKAPVLLMLGAALIFSVCKDEAETEDEIEAKAETEDETEDEDDLSNSGKYTVSTLAGNGDAGFADGTGTAAQFNGPVGVAVDGAGNVYVADVFNNRIRKITPEGVVSTLAGNGHADFADGIGKAARFNRPDGVAVDGAGNVYVADRANHSIRKITPEGVVSTLAGNGYSDFADGTGTAARFDGNAGVGVDGAGNVYVADTFNHRIRKITR
jgi:sugar lactone lactonase YvrE